MTAANLARLNRPGVATSLASQLDATQPMSDAFPDVEPGIKPFGSKVILQIRSPKTKSIGGILFVSETTEAEKWNQQVGRVHSLGPVAFCDRKTLTPWPEGHWAKPGAFVRVGKYGGDKWEVPTADGGNALFVVFNDTDLIGEVTCDPRLIKAFI